MVCDHKLQCRLLRVDTAKLEVISVVVRHDLVPRASADSVRAMLVAALGEAKEVEEHNMRVVGHRILHMCLSRDNRWRCHRVEETDDDVGKLSRLAIRRDSVASHDMADLVAALTEMRDRGPGRVDGVAECTHPA